MKGDDGTDRQKSVAHTHRLRFFLLGLLCTVVPVTVVCWYASVPARRPEPASRGDDPCDMVLVGVRPDYGDDLFDARARYIGKDPPVNVTKTHWDADRIQREFIFEVPIQDPSFKLIQPVRIYLNGHRGYSVKPRVTIIKSARSTRIVADASLPRLSMRSNSSFARLRGGEPVRTVDINIRYYAGPRPPAEICFSGPFARTQAAHDDQGLGYELRARPHSTGSESLALTLDVSSRQALHPQMPLIVVLADGSWKVAPCVGMDTTEQASVRSYLVRDVALTQLTRVTLNERPWEKTFHQVAVHIPGHANRTYAPFLDALAARLDTEVFTRSEAFRFQYQNELDDPNLALRILDVVRGRALFPVSRAIQQGLRVHALDPSEQERIRSLLKGWLGTELEAHACALGLWGNWPEFVQPSLDRLRWTQFDRLSDQAMANAFQYRDHPTDEEILEVARFLCTRETKHNPTRQALIRFVQSHTARSVGLDAWMQMAECDKPWVWTHVIQVGPAFDTLAQRKGLSDVVRLRAVALGVSTDVEDDALARRAYACIAAWITPELLQKDVEQFRRVFSALVRHGLAQRDTPVLISYLRQQLVYWNNFREKAIYQSPRTPLRNHVGIEKVIKLLNLWYGVNLGELGTDLDQESDPGDHDWMRLIGHVLDWAQAREGV